MNREITCLTLCALLLALSFPVEAQQPKRVPRIGYLAAGFPPSDSAAPLHPNAEAFRQGLRELGYIEGKNIIIEYRYAEQKFERFPELAAELVRLKVDVIRPGGGPASLKAVPLTLPRQSQLSW